MFFGVFSAASCMQIFSQLFYMFHNLFHHRSRMISDSFLTIHTAKNALVYKPLFKRNGTRNSLQYVIIQKCTLFSFAVSYSP